MVPDMSIPRTFPMIQMRQTFAKIGIDADLGEQSIEQPRADMQIVRRPAKLSIEQPEGELVIDQSKAWDALAIGNHLEMMKRMRAQGREIVMETIAKIAQQGDRMAMIHLQKDPIPEFAKEVRLQFYTRPFAGPASYDNVEITYIANKPVIEADIGQLEINVTPNKVRHEYKRGKLDIYMLQYPSLQIIPPQVDLQI